MSSQSGRSSPARLKQAKLSQATEVQLMSEAISELNAGSRAKVEDVFLPVHDGTILVLRKMWGGRSRAVLVLPGLDETIDDSYYDDLGHSLADRETTAFLLELRGHGASEGHWTLEAHRKDLLHVLDIVHKSFPKVFVVAHDLSASVMLEFEHQGQHIDGMVLLVPRFDHIIKHNARGRTVRQHYSFVPVRVQTPTVIFTTSHDHLTKVFGPVRVFGNWTKPVSRIEQSGQYARIKDALLHLQSVEPPIRFR